MSKSAFTDAYASVIAALAALRKEKRVSQVVLAARLGKPQQFVSSVERGERRIDIVEFYAIVQALGADPETVFRDVVRCFPGRIII